MNFSKEQKDYIIHALEHCEILTGGRSSGKTLELIKQQEKEIDKLHSIIKEVREYIYNKEIDTLHFNSKDFLDTSIATELLEILDKGE